MEGGANLSTTTRPELSPKNPYWIDKHRYYELKHFCLQYPIWQKKISLIDGYRRNSFVPKSVSTTNPEEDPTFKAVAARMQYVKWSDMVKNAAKDTAVDLAPYILKAVTEGISYDILRLHTAIPCCRDTYYDLYRRFFWLLSKERQ